MAVLAGSDVSAGAKRVGPKTALQKLRAWQARQPGLTAEGRRAENRAFLQSLEAASGGKFVVGYDEYMQDLAPELAANLLRKQQQQKWSAINLPRLETIVDRPPPDQGHLWFFFASLR